MKYSELLKKLSLRQKADLLSGKDFWSTMAIEELNIPSAFLSDGPHGLRKQAAKSDHLGLNASIPATCFPTAATMANSWDEGLGEQLGEALGSEALSQKVNVILGPGLNIKRDPRCGRNFEYFSEDPYLAGKMAASYVRGIQKKGVSACVKHFAVNNQEKRRMVIDSVVDERTLREIYLTGFEIAVKEGQSKMLMTSYNKVNGIFANENPYLMHVLRDVWGYDGVVVSDWGGCNDRVEGVKVGADLEMPVCKYGNDDVYEALMKGKLTEQEVDACLERLFTWILESDKAIKENNEEFDVEKHHQLAKKCAEESIVLLKNDDVLPLNGNEKLCVIGDFATNPRYQGAGSSIVNPTKLDSFTECLNQTDITYFYTKGYERYGKADEKLAKQAIDLAKKADKILFFAGLDEVVEAEGLDRENIKLPANQLTLLNRLYDLNKPIIVILSCGGAVELDNVLKANGIVHCYLGGQAGALALLDVLTGKVNPSGKLAESLPLHLEDNPAYHYFPGHKMSAEYREGLFVGYRYYDINKVKVAYPFGYGLSYTTFKYDDLKVSEKGVSFTLTNIGKVKGKEVCQLYVGKNKSSIFRPLKELKGFKKVELQPGESKIVEIKFDDKTFRYYNIASKQFEIEEGEYQLYVASSSEDTKLSGAIYQKGTAMINPYVKEKLTSYYSGNIKQVANQEFACLLGHEIPDSEYDFYKPMRLIVHPNTTMDDLKYAPSWIGRFTSWILNFACTFMRAIGNKTTANTITMGVIHQPIRGLAKFGGFSRAQMEGLMLIFNGHFLKGCPKIFKK